MPLRSMKFDEHNMVWRHYDTTPVIWTEYATIIVSNYLNPTYIHTHNIKMWCRFEVHMEYAKNVIENIMLFLNDKWKHSNNISKVDHVAIPNFHDKGTIIFGLVPYRETDIIYDTNLYPVSHKIEVAQLVGRKVTQQWFNNMMNNSLVSDFWFRKGLITLLATYAVNEAYSDYQIINLFVVQNQYYSFNLDCDYHVWPSTSQVNSSLEIPNSIRGIRIIKK
ncbi:aminopeptidase N-like [Nylanderia fulva]|uniref:aminopeptidase N-like n=1 Tax=Nylanderia fulva TaxID=613905 RepID=UPI0010FB30AF|nr:aminopeptidase N-like [Nylanderia fulva]